MPPRLFHLRILSYVPAGSTGQLGLLPPPISLVSLPLSTATALTWSVSAPPSTIPPVSQAPTHVPIHHYLPTGSMPLSTPLSPFSLSSPGMILSPAADPFPQSLVQRVQLGQFVEMRDMLADNIALLSQVSSLHGTGALPLARVNRMRLHKVPSLICWLYCFNA